MGGTADRGPAGPRPRGPTARPATARAAVPPRRGGAWGPRRPARPAVDGGGAPRGRRARIRETRRGWPVASCRAARLPASGVRKQVSAEAAPSLDDRGDTGPVGLAQQRRPVVETGRTVAVPVVLGRAVA